MIRVTVLLGADGLLRKVTADGHAGFGSAGTDIVCAATTALLRTAAKVLEEHDGIEMTGSATGPGSLSFTITSIDPSSRGWLAGVGGFLMRGIGDLHDEYPAECAVEISGAAE